MNAYDFDAVIDRRGTDCSKWDAFEDRFPGLDARGCLPMWVADTDFKAPREVVDAVMKKAAFGIYGYPAPKGDYFDGAVIGLDEAPPQF
jgi:cystathionine beta-lyase